MPSFSQQRGEEMEAALRCGDGGDVVVELHGLMATAALSSPPLELTLPRRLLIQTIDLAGEVMSKLFVPIMTANEDVLLKEGHSHLIEVASSLRSSIQSFLVVSLDVVVCDSELSIPRRLVTGRIPLTQTLSNAVIPLCWTDSGCVSSTLLELSVDFAPNTLSFSYLSTSSQRTFDFAQQFLYQLELLLLGNNVDALPCLLLDNCEQRCRSPNTTKSSVRQQLLQAISFIREQLSFPLTSNEWSGCTPSVNEAKNDNDNDNDTDTDNDDSKRYHNRICKHSDSFGIKESEVFVKLRRSLQSLSTLIPSSTGLNCVHLAEKMMFVYKSTVSSLQQPRSLQTLNFSTLDYETLSSASLLWSLQQYVLALNLRVIHADLTIAELNTIWTYMCSLDPFLSGLLQFEDFPELLQVSL
jgi:hypothetical protein